MNWANKTEKLCLFHILQENNVNKKDRVEFFECIEREKTSCLTLF